jgi:hypothetical protein
MKNNHLLSACAIFMLGSFLFSPTFAQYTIIDNIGERHTLLTNEYRWPNTLTFPADQSYFEIPNTYNNGEIYLHHMQVWDGVKVYYWHGRVIHAGYSFSGSKSQFPLAISQYSDQEQYLNDYLSQHSGTLPDWRYEGQGFVVHDGYDSDNLKYGVIDGPSSSGAVIFRADDYIRLTDGFKVVFNPVVKAYNANSPRDVTAVTKNNGENITITTNGNHRYWNGAHVNLTNVCTSLNGQSFKVVIKGNFWDHPTQFFLEKTEGITPCAYSSGGTVTLDRGELLPDNAYFHAYGGPDRFLCSDLWDNDNTDNSNFQEANCSNGTLFSNCPNTTSSAFKALDFCEDKTYNDLNNVTWSNVTDNGVSYTALKLALVNNQASNNCRCAGCEWSASTIWTNDVLCSSNVICTTATKNNPFRSGLHYGKFSFDCKLPNGSYVKPALWGFVPDIHINPGDLDTRRYTEIDLLDYEGNWFQNSWDQSVSRIDITNAGSGYSNASPPTVTFTGGNPVRAATGTAVVDANGSIVGITITDRGEGYTSEPNISFSIGTATAHANLASSWGGGLNIKSVNVNPGGTGYSSNTALNISGGGGITPQGNIDIAGGVITGVTMTKSGGYYGTAPVITFSDPGIGGNPGGSGASATATVDNRTEDEMYHFAMGCFFGLPYSDRTSENCGSSRGMTANFTQIPNNTNLESFSAHFHNYSLEWIPGEIRFLIDGVEIGRTTRHISDEKISLLVSNQMAYQDNLISEVTPNDIFLRNITITPMKTGTCGITSNKTTAQNETANYTSPTETISLTNIIPNPAKDHFTFSVVINGKSDLQIPMKIELFDVLGRLTKILFEGVQKDNLNKYDFSAEQSNGIYYLRVSLGGLRATKELIINK